MENLVNTFEQLAHEAAVGSAWQGGAAEAYGNAAELVRKHFSGKQSSAVSTPPLALPPPSSVSPISESSPAAKKSKSAEAMAPVFDLLRERATWMTDTEIIGGLRQRGIDASSPVVWRVLTAGVRAGHLERRGDSFRTAPLKP